MAFCVYPECANGTIWTVFICSNGLTYGKTSRCAQHLDPTIELCESNNWWYYFRPYDAEVDGQ